MSAATLPWLEDAVRAATPQRIGAVSSVVGLSIEVRGVRAGVGSLLRIGGEDGPGVLAEVTAVRRKSVTCMPLRQPDGLAAGVPVRVVPGSFRVPVGRGLLGRVIDGTGRPIDGLGPIEGTTLAPVDRAAPEAIRRSRITQALSTGVRSLDTLTTIGRGQRIGLFAGSGVGKSSLLSMITRGTEAACSVIALIGERGREVREFLEDDLGPEGLARSVVVVSTADEPALMRVRAAFAATRIAEAFRGNGEDVVLMMDSLTRVAMAQREIGLSAGEPPATRGYPPSTFSLLARLLERAGTDERGSVTGVYTVLVDGDDHNEPIADTTRSLLDGHIVLSRELTVAGHYPPVDVLGSVSRVASRVTSPEQKAWATTLRRALAARRGVQDLIDVGAYRRGADRLVDAALDNAVSIDAFLRQGLAEHTPASESWAHLARLATTLEGAA
jgi:flagellum-specific ATP synthase